MTEVERQRSTSQQITEALRGGASRGQVFEILRPLALAAGPEYTSDGRVVYSANLLQMFAKIAIDHLVDMPGEELLEWFEAGARPSPMLLHRP